MANTNRLFKQEEVKIDYVQDEIKDLQYQVDKLQENADKKHKWDYYVAYTLGAAPIYLVCIWLTPSVSGWFASFFIGLIIVLFASAVGHRTAIYFEGRL